MFANQELDGLNNNTIQSIEYSNNLKQSTVFIWISAQPRISAHLEKAPILKAEKLIIIHSKYVLNSDWLEALV